MDRRVCLKSSSAALAAVALESKRIAGLARVSAAGRHTLSMNRNWRFSAVRVKGDTARDFDDSHFDPSLVKVF
jgi:hypothetical protein